MSTTQNLYALLVGIDHYPSPVNPLNGCVNDVTAMEQYLTERVAQDGFQLHLRKLIDRDATRQAIIDGFRQHLSKATETDVALFYYAGHGSQQETPPELRYLEPDGLNETIVCWDSRTEGNWDLADKELAKLIAEVSRQNPHILLIMDCCHSGHINRNFGEENPPPVWERGIIPDYRKRPIESFIFSSEEIKTLAAAKASSNVYRGNDRSLEFNPSEPDFLKRRHILLAACRDQEKAKEFRPDEKPRGAFSHFLLKALQNTNGKITYRDLFRQTEASVRSRFTEQSPQIESTNLSDLNQPFLGGAIAKQPPYFTVKRTHQGWVMEGGTVHGIPQPVNGETTQVALFANNSEPSQLRQLAHSIATAKVTTVLPHQSQLAIEEGSDRLNTDTTYKAIVTRFPLPPLSVYLEGDSMGISKVRQALSNASVYGNPSLYVREVLEPAAATFRLQIHPHPYVLIRLDNDRPLPLLEGYTLPDATQIVQRLEHIARWHSIANLSSPPNSRISSNAIQMEFYRGDVPLKEVESARLDTLPLRLEYRYENGNWKEPMFRVKLTNMSDEPLYCALLDLTEEFSIFAGVLKGGGAWLKPGESVWSLDGEPLCGLLPKDLQEQGVTEYRDILQLIACTDAFDATLLEQPKLNAAHTHQIRSPIQTDGTLTRSMDRVITRDLSIRPAQKENCDDWMTKQVVCTIVRPWKAKG